MTVRLATWLTHPLTRGISLDDPRTVPLRRRIIREKRFLRRLYEEWYALLAAALPPPPGPVLELGAGAGFLAQTVTELLTSEVQITPGVALIADGQALPIADDRLRGIVMTNVLHHIPEPRRFFAEAGRTVRPGGALALVEPWITPWSRLVYRHLHHEPCNERTIEWEFPPGGPLSAANEALPWIIFERDRERFAREVPGWRIETVRPLMPIAYLLSGGLAWRSFLPGACYGPVRALERRLERAFRPPAMFALIVLRRQVESSGRVERNLL